MLGVVPAIDGVNYKSDVKAYENAVVASWNEGNVNYTVTVTKAVYTIKAREITVTLFAKSSVYGDASYKSMTFNNSDWSVSADGTYGLAEGDTQDTLGLQLRLELPDRASRGVYTAAIKAECPNNNYSVTYEGGDYTVTPKEISVKIENHETYFGDELAALTFTVDEDTLAYGEVASDLLIELTRAEGETLYGYLCIGEYEISGASKNNNYTVEFENGIYTILRATNTWLREYEALEFPEGSLPPEEQLPVARFGLVYMYYTYDEAGEELIVDLLGDFGDSADVLRTLKPGTYYVHCLVRDNDNYRGLSESYTITVTPSFTVINGELDVGLYVVIWSTQVIALVGALLFMRRRKQKKATKKS